MSAFDHDKTIYDTTSEKVACNNNLEAPQNDDELHAFVQSALGFVMPRNATASSKAYGPFGYLSHAFFEDRLPRDCLVWANRGGGKTQLGAIATMLDLLFKPGIQVRILGGSFDQSSRMYNYLREMIALPGFAPLVDGRVTGKALQLTNGSRVEVLSQSERSVRGQRVHTIRCDEVELFDPDIWQAAQLVTRSGQCGATYVRGSVEALSTMHRPFGLMHRLIEESTPSTRKVFRWNLLDVLERCAPARSCTTCPMWADCRGVAKRNDGFITVDDAITQMKRVTGDVWRSEMLCERPSTRDLVYPEFDVATHVKAFDIEMSGDGGHGVARDERFTWAGGMDFGYRAPTAILWAVHDRAEDVLMIVDESVEVERTTSFHIDRVHERGWPMLAWIGVDPAGHQRNEQTGRSTIQVWRDAGFRIRSTARSIEAGVEAVRARIRAASGAVRLIVHPRCVELIRALGTYHFDPEDPERSAPIKDGPDHIADALRYLVVNLDARPGRLWVRGY